MRSKYAKWLLLGALLAVAPLSRADEREYLDHIRNGGYDSIFAAKILSASTVASDGGGDCYYKYRSVITRSVRGKALPAEFDFSSRTGLQVGTEYLVYFAERDARLHRFGAGPLSKCQRDLSGYFLVFEELHKIDHIWDGKKWIDVVVFDDALETVPAAREIDQTVRSADLDYVTSELRK